ncbi:hypothetical protein [Apibacter adventoris]|nr:hypothetical protein [Apibacter adventoris]
MNDIINIEWFKKEVLPKLNGYEFEYKFFERGDFGSLYQIEFNSEKIGGNIDFWELDWLGIFVWDNKKKEQLLNVLLEPNQKEEKEKVFKQLEEILI